MTRTIDQDRAAIDALRVAEGRTEARDWNPDVEDVRLETSLGPMRVHLCHGANLYVECGSGNFPEGLTVRGVPVYMSTHVEREPGGSWRFSEHTYMKRARSFGDNLPPTYEAKVKAVVLAAVIAWAATAADSDLFLRAEAMHKCRALGSEEGDLRKAEDAYLAAREAYYTARAEYHAADRKLRAWRTAHGEPVTPQDE